MAISGGQKVCLRSYLFRPSEAEGRDSLTPYPYFTISSVACKEGGGS